MTTDPLEDVEALILIRLYYSNIYSIQCATFIELYSKLILISLHSLYNFVSIIY